MAHLNRRNTIQEVMEQSAANIAASRVAKDEDRLANREIHSFGGEQQVWLAIAGGLTTAGLCRSLGISPSSFSRWIERGGQQRMLEYQASKKMQAQLIADQAIEIANKIRDQR
jgi:CRP-like cAMP-binding protein